MSKLTLFQNDKFGNIRVFIRNEEFWFVAKDISDILKYSETNAMTKRLDSESHIRQIGGYEYEINFNK